jgi:general secretion pathway protein F
MPEFVARVFEPAQGVHVVRVQAEHAGAVARVLGLSPAAVLSVQPAAAAAGDRPGPRVGAGRPIDLRLFSQELALLLQSGIPVIEALQTLRESGGASANRQALDRVIGALRQGQSMSDALGGSPRSFDALFVAIVAASERSGQLVRALQDHAAYLTWSQALRARLLAACIYPLLLLGAGLAVVLFLLLYVLPRFATVFEGLGDQVPAASRSLIDFGVWAAAHPAWLTGALAGAVAAVLLVWRWPLAREAAARLLWRTPGLGERWRLVVLARLYRGMGVLLAAGVPVPAAMRLLRPAVAAPLRAALDAAAHDVESGQRLSVAMLAHGLATPVAQRMLRVGEGSGELALMLERAATFHDDEIARLSELMVRAVNPVLMLVMGVLIGGIVVLMYLPIFTLMEQVQ